MSNVDTRSVRDVVGEGALRGRSPRTREGRIGPTAQLQGLGVSGQWSVTGRLSGEVRGGLGVGAVGEVCLTGVGRGAILAGSCLTVLSTGFDQRESLIDYSLIGKT